MVDDVLDEVFPYLPAVALEGAKGVGKTLTGLQRAASVFSLDDERTQFAVKNYPAQITEADSPVLIDEWQLVPTVWDQVRRAVDKNPTAGGTFLLTGSADVPSHARIHSGAGRIISLTMRPLSIAERGIEEPVVSLKELLNGTQPAISGTTHVDLPTYVDEILRSGFPGIRDLPPRARRLQLDGYVRRIVSRELPENGVHVRKPHTLQRWLEAYAAAVSTNLSYTKLMHAATAGEDDKPAKETTLSYRDHLARIFVLEPLNAWLPTFSPLKRLTEAPKHHLVDPSLAAQLAGIDDKGLLRGEGPATHVETWLGALFESLVTQSVRVYAEAAEASVHHMRTRGGEREIDLIIERPDHSVLAIEVKLSHEVQNEDVKHLNWLDHQLGDRLLDRVIVTTGPTAYRRDDGVAVVPLSLLGP